MNFRVKIWASIALLLFVLGIIAWKLWFSTTHIAFLNYQVITLGEITKSNDHPRIKLSILDLENLNDIDKYDMVLINGMGLRITAEQRTIIEEAAEAGLPIVTTRTTNPDNDITSIDSVSVETIKGYLNNGGRSNYRNLLAYIRYHIDGKKIDCKEPAAPIKKEVKQFYHADPKHTDAEALEFNSVASYERFLSENNLLKPNAPHIIITGWMGEPTELVAALEKTGNVVYPMHNMKELIQSSQIDSIQPAAIINMAHGRMGDYIVDYLKKKNIPMFATLNTNRLVEEWEADKMGMSGGFMSQSIVMPEIDGAIRPYALFGNYQDNEGFQYSNSIPERLEKFVATVNKYIALQSKPNRQKRVAIYYYKGPGQNALTAAGMEVPASLYNLLVRMKQEGYHIENLPESPAQLAALFNKQGSVYNAYAKGAHNDFLKYGNPELISAKDYAEWTKKSIRAELMDSVVALDGKFPGSYISTDKGELALPRVQLGNVVLLPQLAAGAGDDHFAIVHGTDAAPPHAYIASYLWAQYAFNADLMIHFGTHGSLEFTPRKQVALSSKDWSDILVGSMPHLYIYSIGDVGEGVIAKRRSYATLQSHLTPPFMESNVRGIYKELCTAIQQYNTLLYADGKKPIEKAALKVKQLTVKLGIHRELRLDSVLNKPYTEKEISRIESFAEELANEKVTGELYTMGKQYSSERIRSSVFAMSTEPIAYSWLALDKLRGKSTKDLEKHTSLFTQRYLTPARDLVNRLLEGKIAFSDHLICATANITQAELDKAREIEAAQVKYNDLLSKMMSMSASGTMKHSNGKSSSEMKGKHPSWIPKIGKRPEKTKKKEAPKTDVQAQMKAMLNGGKEYTKQEKEFSRVILEIERTLSNVGNYKHALEESPEIEFVSLLNAMNGGYTAPSPGGDPIANPNTIPTGRNLYAINAEATPSELAWERGKELAKNTIEMYRKRHNDSIPRKVSYTLWSGEFVETEGATIAQILYMLGVEPIRDVFGRVTDIRLIPSEELERPRIDVVVQTSGQLRDIAASRLFLISRAVEMAAAAKNDHYDNYVSQSVVDAERTLIEKGLSPKQAREVSTYRVFGGVNGNYGTGITDMVQSSGKWDNTTEIADVYLQNMGAFYGSEKAWEQVQKFALEAALVNTDAVIQPRQSNTWGALSLDHVYEFMGGMNLAIRKVTGKEPDAYMSDYRNHNNMRMQELKEAIGIESRTTIFNPHYIKEKMNGESSSAAGFAEIMQNIFGWETMKPEVIDNELWDKLYDVYVQDEFNLGVRKFFEKQNPAALEEMSAIMMEAARKGMWKTSKDKLEAIARLHTELINQHKPSCSGFVCDNSKLRDFISSNTSPEIAKQYKQNIQNIRETSVSGDKGMVLKQESMNETDNAKTLINNMLVAVVCVVVLAGLILFIRQRRKNIEK